MARYNLTSGQARGRLGGLEYQMRGGKCIVRSKRKGGSKGGTASSLKPADEKLEDPPEFPDSGDEENPPEPRPSYKGELSGSLKLYQSGLLYREIQTGLIVDKTLIPEAYQDCILRLTLSLAIGGKACGSSLDISLDSAAELGAAPQLLAEGTVIGTAVLYSLPATAILSEPFPVVSSYEVLGASGEAPLTVTLWPEDAGGGDGDVYLEITGSYRDLSYYPGTVECSFRRPLWGHLSMSFEGLESGTPVEDGMRGYLETDKSPHPLGVNGRCSFTREDSGGDYPVIARNISLIIAS